MSVQPTQPDQRIIGELLDAFRKRNGICLYPGCQKIPIASHFVAEQTLKLIAENGTVLTWDLRNNTLIKHIKAGLPLDQLYFEPTDIGVGQKSKVTFPLFCEYHDSSVFAPLEQGNFSSQLTSEQMLLIAYRALCAATYDQLIPERTFSVGEKYGELSTYSRPDKLPRLNRLLNRDMMLLARQQHEKILLTQDHQQLEGQTYLVNIPPCIASTHARVPSDALDAMLIINGAKTLTTEDVIVTSFFPYPPQHSVFILSWLRSSQRAHTLVNYTINSVPEKEKTDYFLNSALQAPNVYISPTWWKSLSQEQKKTCIKIHLTASREFAALV